jgi:type IV fimbrial biogenesis protein FimT
MSAQNGFTLTELMVTVAVISIGLVLGAPSFKDMLETNRIATQSNALVGAMQFARSEAVKRGARVTMCKSADTSELAPSCTNNGNWQEGWVVFLDTNNNASVDNEELILLVHNSVGGEYSMTGDANTGNYISFIGSGWPQLTTGQFQSGTINVCREAGSPGRAITLSANGRVAIVEITC